jgi:lipid II isoglutaminyl synthase (glutamine-hydrolysing)
MLKLTLIIFLSKLIKRAINLVPSLGGTALPGLIALKLGKNILKNLVAKNNLNSIIITGTNGKTTTSRLVAQILTKANIPFFQNRSGSNLIRGITSSLLAQVSAKGKLPSNLAIFEVDEAVVPQLSKILDPKIILFNNLFRDQLDRYGEIDTILTKWQETLKHLNPKTTVIYNCDDPSLEYLTKGYKNKVSFGLSESFSKTKTLSSSADAIFCLSCHKKLNFSHIFTSHLGHYSCPSCNFKRSTPQVTLDPKTFSLELHNQYNLLAAKAVAQALKIDSKTINQGLKSFTPAFGRGETLKLGDLNTKILLVKNPTGYNVILESLAQKKSIKSTPILLALNDNIADGTDVSWIWDVNFNCLKYQKAPIIVSGIRAKDLNLRLKYAGVKSSNIILEPNLKQALNLLKNQAGTSAYILPTYTAMLNLRKILTKQKIIHSTWSD